MVFLKTLNDNDNDNYNGNCNENGNENGMQPNIRLSQTCVLLRKIKRRLPQIDIGSRSFVHFAVFYVQNFKKCQKIKICSY